MSNINIDEWMGDYDIDSDENMGDSDKETNSTISTDLDMLLSNSSGNETDDIKSDPNFRCKVKKSFQSTVKEGLRSGTEISIEPFVDPLPPEIIINLLPHNDDQTFVAIYNEEFLIEGGEF